MYAIILISVRKNKSYSSLLVLRYTFHSERRNKFAFIVTEIWENWEISPQVPERAFKQRTNFGNGCVHLVESRCLFVSFD